MRLSRILMLIGALALVAAPAAAQGDGGILLNEAVDLENHFVFGDRHGWEILSVAWAPRPCSCQKKHGRGARATI